MSLSSFSSGPTSSLRSGEFVVSVTGCLLREFRRDAPVACPAPERRTRDVCVEGIGTERRGLATPARPPSPLFSMANGGTQRVAVRHPGGVTPAVSAWRHPCGSAAPCAEATPSWRRAWPSGTPAGGTTARCSSIWRCRRPPADAEPPAQTIPATIHSQVRRTRCRSVRRGTGRGRRLRPGGRGLVRRRLGGRWCGLGGVQPWPACSSRR